MTQIDKYPLFRAGCKIRQALAEASLRLGEASDTPRLDAELLMAHAVGVERDELIMRCLEDSAPETFAALLERRLAHEPMAYIIGARDFWTIRLKVGPGVLIPRPDSETLVEAAVDHFSGQKGPCDILDLGTGPGTLLLAALSQWPEAQGLGIDASGVALAYAQANAEALGLASRTRFQIGDWGAEMGERFDLILCNPPYVEADAVLAPQVRDFEPYEALFAGTDGLDDYRRLAHQFPKLLAPGGIVALEIGAGQAKAVGALMVEQSLIVNHRADLGGHVRCLILRQN